MRSGTVDDLETLRLEIFKSQEWFERIAEYGTPFLFGRDITPYISVGSASKSRHLALVIPRFKPKYPEAFVGLLLLALKGTFKQEAFSVEIEDVNLRLNIDQFVVGGNDTILQHCTLTGQTWGSESVQYVPSVRLTGDQILQLEVEITRGHPHSFLGKHKLKLCDEQEANNNRRACILSGPPWNRRQTRQLLKQIRQHQDMLYEDSNVKPPYPVNLDRLDRTTEQRKEGGGATRKAETGDNGLHLPQPDAVDIEQQDLTTNDQGNLNKNSRNIFNDMPTELRNLTRQFLPLNDRINLGRTSKCNQEGSDLEILRSYLFKSENLFNELTKYGTPMLVGRDVEKLRHTYLSGDVWTYGALVFPGMHHLEPSEQFRELILSALKGTFQHKTSAVEFQEIKLRLNIDQCYLHNAAPILSPSFASSCSLIRRQESIGSERELRQFPIAGIESISYVKLTGNNICIYKAAGPLTCDRVEFSFGNEQEDPQHQWHPRLCCDVSNKRG